MQASEYSATNRVISFFPPGQRKQVWLLNGLRNERDEVSIDGPHQVISFLLNTRTTTWPMHTHPTSGGQTQMFDKPDTLMTPDMEQDPFEYDGAFVFACPEDCTKYERGMFITPMEECAFTLQAAIEAADEKNLRRGHDPRKVNPLRA